MRKNFLKLLKKKNYVEDVFEIFEIRDDDLRILKRGIVWRKPKKKILS